MITEREARKDNETWNIKSGEDDYPLGYNHQCVIVNGIPILFSCEQFAWRQNKVIAKILFPSCNGDSISTVFTINKVTSKIDLLLFESSTSFFFKSYTRYVLGSYTSCQYIVNCIRHANVFRRVHELLIKIMVHWNRQCMRKLFKSPGSEMCRGFMFPVRSPKDIVQEQYSIRKIVAFLCRVNF